MPPTPRTTLGPLVAGVDSSTQSCKVVIREAATGALVRHGRASHPEGTEVDPEAWWTALQSAIADAGGLDGVAAISVGGQQHGDWPGGHGQPCQQRCAGPGLGHHGGGADQLQRRVRGQQYLQG